MRTAEDRPPPPWELLLEVYKNALKELIALRDPHLDPLIQRLMSRYGLAMIELELCERAQRAILAEQSDRELARRRPSVTPRRAEGFGGGIDMQHLEHQG